MITADLTGERAFAEITRLCHAGLDPETLFRRVAEPLRRALPFEGYAASTFDPLSGLPTGLVSNEEMGGKDDARFFVEHVYFEDDVNEYGWMARERIAVARLSDGTGGRLERALRHRLYNAPKGFGYELRAVLTTDRNPWGGLCLVRERGDRDFDEREVAFMRRVVPPLTAGLRVATLYSEARREPTNDEASDTAGVLVLDNRGRVARYTRAAERWLRELGATEARREDGGDLPAAVWSVVGALRRALGPGTTGGYPTEATRLRVRGRSGRWLTLQASLTEPGPGNYAETVVVIAPAEPREVARFHTAAYGLSAREEEIAALVLRCASTRQISTALYISESTVQGHLSRIFAKAGVKSRRELLKRLLLDDLPSDPVKPDRRRS
jgi:DNA-binding CsgD family transcriptional regulator